MKKTILILSAVAVLFIGCDKISPDNYTQGSSSGSSNWSNVNVHRAFVEKYTGPKCKNCPTADVTLDAAHHQFGDQLVIISINHPTGQGVPWADNPDLRTDDGTAWAQYFGISELPSAYLNRGTHLYTGSMSEIVNDIEKAIAQTAQAGISMTATADGNEISISVDVELYTQISDGLTLTLALTEDSLIYKQSMPGETEPDEHYVHNHMLRDVITNTWGDDIPMEGLAGEHKIGRFTYTVTNDDIKLENCHIVALLSRKSDRSVVNCIETPIN